MKRILFSIIVVLTNIIFAEAQIVINEYMCSNKSFNADNFGNYEDWIELYNSGAAAVNIGGYYLSDNAANPTKYMIPAGTTINAAGFKRFYASNKNVVVGTNIHTNFKLTQMKYENIIFSDGSGVVLDSLTIKPMQMNHSRGRTPNGGNTWGVLTTPTPNANNTNVLAEYMPRVSFNTPGGFYTGSVNVSITCTNTSAIIRYTTNGQTPTATSTQYTTPINVSTTTLIKARAFSNGTGVPAGFVENNTYFINVDNHNLPVVSLGGNNFNNLFNGGFGGPNEIYSSIEYYEKDKTFKWENDGDVRPHGNDSWNFDQKGIRYYVRDEYGEDNNIDYPLFSTTPRHDFDVIIIKAAGSDNYPGDATIFPVGAHLRDGYSQTLSEKHDLQLDERKYQPCIAFINGQYWGLYEIRERVDADFTNYYYNQPKDKVDMLAYWGGITVEEGSDTGWVNLYNFIMNNNMTLAGNYNYANNTLDFLSLIDYIILNTFTVNSDWLNWNTAWWRGRKETANTPKVKWKYRLWDQDNTFGLGSNYTGLPTTGPTADPCTTPTFTGGGGNNAALQGHMAMANKLMDNPAFKAMYVNRYSELVNTTFNCDTMIAHLDAMQAVLAPEMTNHTARWGGSLTGWNAKVQSIRTFMTTRCTAINQSMQTCYNVTGPYNLKLNVDPPGTGNITMNVFTPPYYVYQASYYGGYQQQLLATPAVGWAFSYWTKVNHTLAPNDSTDQVSFTLNSADSIVAHFVLLAQAATISQISAICVNTGGTYPLTVTTASTNGGYYACASAPGAVVFNGSTFSFDANGLAPGNYIVSYTDSLNNFPSDTMVVAILPIANASFSLSQYTACLGSSTLITATAQQSGGTWSVSPATTAFNTATGQFSVNAVTSAATYTVQYIVGAACPDTVTKSIQIISSPTLNITAIPATICKNQPAITLTATPTGGSWSGSSGLTGPSFNPAAAPSGTNVLTYQFGVPGCTASQSVSIDVIAVPGLPGVSQAQVICEGTPSSTLTATGVSGATFNWYTSASLTGSVNSNSTYNPAITAADSFYVTQTINGCRSQASGFSVIFYPAPEAIFTATPTEGYKPLSVIFLNTSTNSVIYAWDFGNSGTSSEISPTYQYPEAGEFDVVLTVTSNLGCTDTASIKIIVKDKFEIIVPNVFTPNGDGKNDVFYFKSSTDVDDLQCVIFDRWGKKVYTFSSANDVWNGDKCPAGVYYYTLSAKSKTGNEAISIDGKKLDDAKPYSGFVQLVRE